MVGIMQMLLSSGGRKEVTYNITANTNNLNLLSYATSPSRPEDTRYNAGDGGWDITFQVSPGVYVGSTSTTANSVITGAAGPTGWNPDVTLTLVNQGLILGKGGNGGKGSTQTGAPTTDPATPGQAGGTAVVAQREITIQNANVIAGGGGGGGGGGINFVASSPISPELIYGGGGGGGAAGQQPGSGGSGGSSTAGNPGQPGQAGTVSAGGSGGIQPNVGDTPTFPGKGGNGGGRGAAGQAGDQGNVPGSARPGGAAGYYAKGASNITWQATGTRQGQVQPTV
jgi:hypothetical protein